MSIPALKFQDSADLGIAGSTKSEPFKGRQYTWISWFQVKNLSQLQVNQDGNYKAQALFFVSTPKRSTLFTGLAFACLQIFSIKIKILMSPNKWPTLGSKI